MKGLKKAVEMMNSMKVFGASAVEIHYDRYNGQVIADYIYCKFTGEGDYWGHYNIWQQYICYLKKGVLFCYNYTKPVTEKQLAKDIDFCVAEQEMIERDLYQKGE